MLWNKRCSALDGVFSPEGPKQHPLLSWIRPLARMALGRRQCWACFSDLTAWQTHMGTAHPVCFEKETMETLTTNTPIDSNSQFGRESRERNRVGKLSQLGGSSFLNMPSHFWTCQLPMTIPSPWVLYIDIYPFSCPPKGIDPVSGWGVWVIGCEYLGFDPPQSQEGTGGTVVFEALMLLRDMCHGVGPGISDIWNHLELVTRSWSFFLKYVGKNNPNWRTHIFQRGRYTTNQKGTIFPQWEWGGEHNGAVYSSLFLSLKECTSAHIRRHLFRGQGRSCTPFFLACRLPQSYGRLNGEILTNHGILGYHGVPYLTKP